MNTYTMTEPDGRLDPPLPVRFSEYDPPGVVDVNEGRVDQNPITIDR